MKFFKINNYRSKFTLLIPSIQEYRIHNFNIQYIASGAFALGATKKWSKIPLKRGAKFWFITGLQTFLLLHWNQSKTQFQSCTIQTHQTTCQTFLDLISFKEQHPLVQNTSILNIPSLPSSSIALHEITKIIRNEKIEIGWTKRQRENKDKAKKEVRTWHIEMKMIEIPICFKRVIA